MAKKNQTTENVGETDEKTPELLAYLSNLEGLLILLHKSAGEHYHLVLESRFQVTSMMNQAGYLSDVFREAFRRQAGG